MKNKNKIIIIGCIAISLLAVISYFGINYFLNKDLEKAKNELDKTIEKYGYVEKESVYTLISKFNTKILDSGLEYPVSDDYLTVENNEYWYGVYDDIYCFIVPSNFSGAKEDDIVEMIGIYYPKNSQNEELAKKYILNLLRANNEELTDNDINNLIKDAKENSNENAQSGKGIALAIKETDEYFNYQVIRIYR